MTKSIIKWKYVSTNLEQMISSNYSLSISTHKYVQLDIGLKTFTSLNHAKFLTRRNLFVFKTFPM